MMDLFREADMPQKVACLFASVTLVTCIIHRSLRAIAKWRFRRQNGCRNPVSAPSGLLGLGKLLSLLAAMKRGESLALIRTWHQEYGKTFKVQLGRPRVITIEPKNVQTVLALKFKDFELGERNKALSPLLGQGIFASDGQVWEHSRALLRPNFVRTQIADMHVYERHVSNLIKRIPKDGSTVDLQTLFFQMTIDSATEFLFGESIDSLGAGDSQPKFARDFNLSQEGLAIRTRLGPLMFLHKDRAFSEATVEARRFVDQFVQRAVEYRASHSKEAGASDASEEGYVFLYELSKRTADRKMLTDQLLNVLLAGRDTTASLLSITCFTLARRRDVWDKLREEVLALGDKTPSFEDLKSMKYLNWVLNETLRLYPVVPLNSRTAVRDTFLPTGGGPDGKHPTFVPKGVDVVYSVYSMHRLPEVYGPDADEYRPERWATVKPGWAYLPFNGGPRICPGQQFALTEACYTMVQIVRHFKSMESRDDRPFVEGLTLTLASENGTKVALTPA